MIMLQLKSQQDSYVISYLSGKTEEVSAAVLVYDWKVAMRSFFEVVGMDSGFFSHL